MHRMPLALFMAMARLRVRKPLKFHRFPPPEERLFDQFYAERAYRRARFGVIFGFFAWISFFVWDYLGFPQRLSELAAIRLGLVAPVIGCLAGFIVCCPRRFKAGMQVWLSTAPAAAALGMFLMMTIAQQDNPNKAFQQFWPAYSILFFFLYMFLGMRLIPAAVLGVSSFGLVWWAGLRPGVEFHVLGSALLQLAILNFLGMALCVRVELQERTVFRLRQHHFRLARAARQERAIAQEARDEALLENVRAEAALMLAGDERKKLAVAIAEKERFLSAAYHDLQQPLSTIGIYVRLAKAKLEHDPDPAIQADLEVIASAGQDIAQMFRGVRDAWEAGVAQPHIEAVSLNAVLEEIEREVRDRAELKGLVFRVCKTPRTAVWVVSDRTLLKRALCNLVGNAIKYTERGGVLVGAVDLKSRVRIDVCDTGPGIAEQFQSRIFEEYFQVGNPENDHRKGLGLGLAIVRRIERNLPGHSLRFTSRPGTGSRFSLYAPKGSEPDKQLPESGPIGAPAELDRVLEGRYFVIVEDDPANLSGLIRLIRDAGCLVEGVDGVEAARRLFAERERCPDVLVTDFRLRHGQTGLDAVMALRERFEWATEIPVLFVTGELEAASKLAGFQGVHRIHYKPIAADALLAQLRELVTLPRD